MFVNESEEEVGGRSGIVEEHGGINNAGVPMWESNSRMLGDVLGRFLPSTVPRVPVCISSVISECSQRAHRRETCRPYQREEEPSKE